MWLLLMMVNLKNGLESRDGTSGCLFDVTVSLNDVIVCIVFLIKT